MSVIWTTVLLMSAIGLLAALLLYVAAKKFYVYEDPRISEVEALLPGANCGGCGYSGCHGLAEACCTASSLEGKYCPSAGAATMIKIGKILGLAPEEALPKVARLSCNGSCSLRPATSRYEGPQSCALEALVYSGTTACTYGCLGCGDCREACPFGAITIDSDFGLPIVNLDKCVGCGKCVAACPRNLMQLVPKRDTFFWVACSNHDKGGQAMKECNAACIGCGKCMRVCSSKAIKVENFVAKIDQTLCTACGACMEVCPRHSIQSNKEVCK